MEWSCSSYSLFRTCDQLGHESVLGNLKVSPLNKEYEWMSSSNHNNGDNDDSIDDDSEEEEDDSDDDQEYKIDNTHDFKSVCTSKSPNNLKGRQFSSKLNPDSSHFNNSVLRRISNSFYLFKIMRFDGVLPPTCWNKQYISDVQSIHGHAPSRFSSHSFSPNMNGR